MDLRICFMCHVK